MKYCHGRHPSDEGGETGMRNVEELPAGFVGLLDRGSSMGPDRPQEGRAVDSTIWLGEALGDVGESLRRLRRRGTQSIG